MDATVQSLPNDTNSLKDLVIQLQESVVEKTLKLKHQKEMIDQLLEAIRLSKHQHFGTRSEKFNIDQLDLLVAELLNEPPEADVAFESSGDSETITVKSFARKKGGRRKMPPHLPRIEIIHELEDAACQCGTCSSEFSVIGEKVSEQIDLIPMTVRVIRHIPKTYQCPNCNGSVQAATLPNQPIPGSIVSPGTLAHIATDKYINGLPLYRQEVQFNRLDILLTRSTIAQWMVKAGLLVQSLINLLREQLLASHYIQMDETRCQVLKEPGKTPQSQSYMWIQRGGPPGSLIVLFDYDPNPIARGAETTTTGLWWLSAD